MSSNRCLFLQCTSIGLRISGSSGGLCSQSFVKTFLFCQFCSNLNWKEIEKVSLMRFKSFNLIALTMHETIYCSQMHAPLTQKDGSFTVFEGSFFLFIDKQILFLSHISLTFETFFCRGWSTIYSFRIGLWRMSTNICLWNIN